MARTAGSARRGASWGLLVGLFAAVMLQPGGCGGASPADQVAPEIADAMRALLEAVWPEVVSPALDRAQADADALVAATVAWAEAEGSGGDVVGTRAAAQEAWRALMGTWQELEVMQVGPAGSSLTAVGGEDLRDEVYSWPTINRCRVDQETVAGLYGDPAFLEENLVNVYGLDALENLLFAAPDTNDCPSQVDINAEGTWDALVEAGELQGRRAAYAVVVAEGVAGTLATLESRWTTDDFAGQLAGAGEAGSPYESQDQAVNGVFDALYYLETRTQDRKLGGPLGVWDCGMATCLAEVETTLAGGSNEWVAANLRGFRGLFTGGAGAGMDDLLTAVGHEDLAVELLTQLDEADAAAAALTVPIDVAVQTDPAPAEALLTELSDVTGLLEGDVATILALQIPSEAAGDND